MILYVLHPKTCTACLVCFIGIVNGHCIRKEKKRKEEAYPWKAGASNGHTTNLKQSILRLSISMVAPPKEAKASTVT